VSDKLVHVLKRCWILVLLQCLQGNSNKVSGEQSSKLYPEIIVLGLIGCCKNWQKKCL